MKSPKSSTLKSDTENDPLGKNAMPPCTGCSHSGFVSSRQLLQEVLQRADCSVKFSGLVWPPRSHFHSCKRRHWRRRYSHFPRPTRLALNTVCNVQAWPQHIRHADDDCRSGSRGKLNHIRTVTLGNGALGGASVVSLEPGDAALPHLSPFHLRLQRNLENAHRR